MPLYEYKCTVCAHRFERIMKFSDAPLKTCPKCGKDTIKQLISASAMLFKGSGWYVTDYARKGSNSDSSFEASNPTERSDSAKLTVSSDSTSASSHSSGNGGGSSSASPSSGSSDHSSSNSSTATSGAAPSSSATSGDSGGAAKSSSTGDSK